MAAYGFLSGAIGFASASWQWQPTPHDPSNIIELSDVVASGVTANASLTESADTLSSAAVLAIQAAFSKTEGADTLSSASVLAIQAVLNATEGADTLTAAAALAIVANASLTEGSDTVSADGSSAASPITGDASLTESADTVTSAAVLALQAAASITEGADTLSATGSSLSAITADASITEGADTLSADATIADAVTPIRRGDDGGSFSFTGAARKAIYDRQLAELEDELETAPRPAKRKEKAKRIRELVIAADEPVFAPLRTELPPLIEQYAAQEIDWDTLSAAIEEQIAAVKRRRRNRNIAIAMLMAA